ncbi:MAG: fructose 1,6-bisphosphatase [Deltaproteobacteria bacterium]|nr:fructose 1,6-bisphosphatase [Deltaproteobacteria bacterium]
MAGEPKITLSVITADIGGFIGHVSSHPDVLDTAKERLFAAREKKIIIDFHVLRCGDDLELIITHGNGPNDRKIHELAWNIFTACKEVADELKLYATGRGLDMEGFMGDIRCKGPGIAEMEFLERSSEPVIVLMANKAGVGAWNMPLYKVFADPSNTPGLFMEPTMLEGFSFTIYDLQENREVQISTPTELYHLLALIGSTCRYIVISVSRNSDREVAAVTAVHKYNLMAGRVMSKSESSVIFRCQAGFPAIGEVMEAFSFPHLVSGWMRGSHIGPLMPVPFYEANPTRFEGPPRLIGAGFQISNGKLIGPHDMFDDPSFDEARKTANKATEYMRRHGAFQPHRMAQSELEYSSLPMVMDKLKDRFRKK